MIKTKEYYITPLFENRKKVISNVLLTIGCIFLIVMISVLLINKSSEGKYIKQNATIAKIVNHDDYNEVYIKYDIIINGEHLVNSKYLLNTYIPFFYEGKEINIYFDPINYDIYYINYFPVLVLGCSSLLLLLVAFLIFYSYKKANRKQRYFKSCGNKIVAHIIKVEENENIELKNYHLIKIICEYHDSFSEEKHIFVSEEFYVKTINNLIGLDVIVYIIPNTGFKEYYVDKNKIKICIDEL